MKQNPKSTQRVTVNYNVNVNVVKKRSIIVRVAVLLVAVYMVATLVSLGNTYADAKAEYDALVNYRDSLKLTNQKYRELLESDSHAEIIEQAARDRLGYVYSDEEIYIDISGN